MRRGATMTGSRLSSSWRHTQFTPQIIFIRTHFMCVYVLKRRQFVRPYEISESSSFYSESVLNCCCKYRRVSRSRVQCKEATINGQIILTTHHALFKDTRDNFCRHVRNVLGKSGAHLQLTDLCDLIESMSVSTCYT